MPNPHVGKQKQERRVATLSELVEQLPSLRTPEDAQRSLELIRNMALSGLLAGSAAGAAVRSVEVWLKAHQLDLDIRRIREMESQIEALEAELKRARGLRAV